VIREVTETRRLQDRRHERSILHDRGRIAGDLRDKGIQRIFAAGLALEGAAAMTTQREVRRRVRTSVDDLDQATGFSGTLSSAWTTSLKGTASARGS
jgi:signal transduction histidine kinase